MYKIAGLVFCLLEGVLIAIYGWIALLWSTLGFIIGLFITAQMVLPLLLGLPLAFSLVSKKQMRPKIFLVLFRTPVIWIIQLSVLGFILGWFWPTAVNWIVENQTLNIGMSFGSIAILLTPLSKKGRDDFRADFDKVYGRYYTDINDFNLKFTDINDKKQTKQIEAAIKISSNLYIHTTLSSKDILRFRLPESRFRYMLFCLSIVVKSCEDLMKAPYLLINECLHFLSIYTTSKENVQEYFNGLMNSHEAESNGSIYIQEFLKNLSIYFDAVKSGDKYNASKIIYSVIHSTESNESVSQTDTQRLEQLSWEIEQFIPSMRNAFIDSI